MLRISVAEAPSPMKLVNWNVAWANPRSKESSVFTRAAKIRNRIDRYLPDIVCLTKANLGFFKDGHEISSGPDYGCGYQENRRKVLLWSKESWERGFRPCPIRCLR